MKENYSVCITRKLAVFILYLSFLSFNAAAQTQGKVRGTVSDPDGNVLPGITVSVFKTSDLSRAVINTQTNVDGVFNLDNLEENQTYNLAFSGIGYEKYTHNNLLVRRGEQNSLIITLKIATTGLDELVVIGFGTQSRANMTSAVSTVDTRVLQDRPSPTVANMLQGTTPGLVVTRTSGRPGAQGLSIAVRGETSANGAVNPLYVIDGVISTQSTFTSLNPEDIENISVLKDGGATAIYGSQSAGGVILVTTKKGQKGKPKISFSTNTAFQTPRNLPQRLSLADEFNYVNLARANSGLAPEYTEEDLGYAQNGPVFVLGANGQWRTYNQKSHIHEAIKKTYNMYNNNVQVSGGKDRVNYMVSLGNMEQQGLFKVGEDHFSRWNARVNVSAQVNKYLNVQVGSAYTREGTDNPQDGGYGLEGGGNGILRQFYSSRGRFPLYTDDGSYFISGTSSAFGFALLKDGGFNRDQKHNYFNNVTATIDNFAKGLKFTLIYGRENILQENRNFRRTVTYYSGPTTITRQNNPNSYTITKYNTLQSNYQAQADYDFGIGDQHNFHIMGGYQMFDYAYDYVSSSTRNLFVNENPSLNFTSDPLNKSHTQYARSERMQAYFGRLNYNFDSKYLFEATLRSDESSRLSDGNRVKVFPSFSAGWNMSREAWFDGISHLVDELKPRVSWGKVGSNVGIGYFDYIAQLSTGSNIVLGNARQTYIYQNAIPATEIGWETIETRNIGLDFSMLNRKLNGAFEYFNKFNNNMLVNISLPATIGINIPKTNDGRLKTWGWEFALNYTDKIGKDLTYNIGANIADNKNRLIRYGGANNIVNAGVNNLVEGYALNSIWAYKTDGYFQNQADLDNAPSYIRIVNKAGVPGLGDVRYVDANGDGEISPGKNTLEDSGDLVYMGDINPRYQFGVNAGLGYKNFDFNFFVQGIGKRNFKPSNELIQPQIEPWYQPMTFHLDYWTPENPDAAFPRPFTQGTHNFQNADRWFLNGAYARLKNVQLGYTLNKQSISKLPINRLRLYVSGEDLLTWSKMGVFKGVIDPEQPQNTISAYPFATSISFGLNMDF